MPKPPNTVRISIDVPEKTFNIIQKHVVWGLKARMFRALCEDLAECLQKHPAKTIDGIINKTMRLTFGGKNGHN